MKHSEQLTELFKALTKVQASLKGAIKDSTNPHYKSNYADLESCWAASRDILTANGFCVIQSTGMENGEPGIETTLGHSSGQWVQGFLPLTMAKKDPQAQGSAITYARRYAFAAMIGLIQIDDDGESAMDRSKVETPPIQKPPLQSVNGGSTPVCEKCKAELKLSNNGQSLYCPNFRDDKNGAHSRVPAPRTA